MRGSGDLIWGGGHSWPRGRRINLSNCLTNQTKWDIFTLNIAFPKTGTLVTESPQKNDFPPFFNLFCLVNCHFALLGLRSDEMSNSGPDFHFRGRHHPKGKLAWFLSDPSLYFSIFCFADFTEYKSLLTDRPTPPTDNILDRLSNAGLNQGGWGWKGVLLTTLLNSPFSVWET